jgi:MFS transporter, Spinster family, sphingosine-1-phosphate transporter
MSEKKTYKWEVLALLWFAFLLNQADRQVFNVVLPSIREDLHLTDTQIGTIATIFNLVYALLVPFAGYAGDLFSRKWLVVLSVLIFSVATMFTGFSNGILALIIIRSIATGAGEAFYGPANYALLASYHKSTRALAMSIHQTSYYIGIILSGLLAGYIGERWGWRNSFYAFGIIGVIHGIVLITRLKDKKEEEINKDGHKVEIRQGFEIIFKTPTALILTIAFSGVIFVLTGYLTWMPTYLYETFGMSLSHSGFYSVFYTHLFAAIGVIIAGKYSDLLAKKNPATRLLFQAFGLLAAVPFILMIGNSNALFTLYIGFAGFGFARAFFDANTYTILYDVIPQKYHSSASGVMIMIGFGVGSLAPLVLGIIKPVFGLSLGISSLACVWLFCGVVLLIAYKFYFNMDYSKVHKG